MKGIIRTGAQPKFRWKMSQLHLVLLGAFLLPYLAASFDLLRSMRGVGSMVTEWLDHEPENCDPREVHVALGRDPSQAILMWRTTASDCSTHSWVSRDKQYSAGNSSLLKSSANGHSFMVEARDMCSEPARAEGFAIHLHQVLLTGLEPDTWYRYGVGSDDYKSSFLSAPLVGSRHKVRFIAYGDMGEDKIHPHKAPGSSMTAAAVLREVEKHDVGFVLHVGDISYADGRHKMWRSFMDMIEPVASQTHYMIAIGNHEYDYVTGKERDPSGELPYHPSWGNFGEESGGECGVMAARRFAMPNQDRDNAPFWYSYDYGSVHVTVISTEHDLSPGSTQYDWLHSDLKNVNRCRTPWLIVGLHRPMYVVYPHKDNRIVGEHIRDSIEHMFVKYEVDLTIAGHVHSYYRTCAVADGECVGRDNGGVIHLIIGTAGHKLSDIDGSEHWCDRALAKFGFGRFAADDDTLLYEFVASDGGDVLDSFSLRARRGNHYCSAAPNNTMDVTLANVASLSAA